MSYTKLKKADLISLLESSDAKIRQLEAGRNIQDQMSQLMFDINVYRPLLTKEERIELLNQQGITVVTYPFNMVIYKCDKGSITVLTDIQGNDDDVLMGLLGAAIVAI